MGVDFYLHWDGQTKDEADSQITGFATVGDRGYIRESYGGSDLATEVFCPESFEFHPCFVVADRETFVVPEDTSAEGGQPGTVLVSDLEARMPAVKRSCARRAGGDKDYAAEHFAAFVAFLALAEAKLAEGRRVWIYNSY